MLIQHFESSVYVDVYELKLKNFEKMYSFFLSNKVNTETAEYKSRHFQMFIYINNSIIDCDYATNDSSTNLSEYICRFTIKIPLHVRYHAVSKSAAASKLISIDENSTDEYFNFTIKRPRLFITNCSAHLHQLELNPNKKNKILELPCERNRKSKNDYLIYLDNNNEYNKSSLKNLKLNENLCMWNELKLEQVFY